MVTHFPSTASLFQGAHCFESAQEKQHQSESSHWASRHSFSVRKEETFNYSVFFLGKLSCLVQPELPHKGRLRGTRARGPTGAETS